MPLAPLAALRDFADRFPPEYQVAANLDRIAADPGDVQALADLGMATWRVGLLDVSAALFAEAERLRPDLAVLPAHLGSVLHDQGDAENALLAYERALALDPTQADVHANRGILLQNCGEIEQAIAAYNQALRHNPQHGAAHYNLGNAYRQQGRGESALAAYDEAIRLLPSLIEARANKALCLRENGRLDEAVTLLEGCIAEAPAIALLYNNLGEVLLAKGCPSEAEPRFRRALELDPQGSAARCNLASALHDQRRLDEALAEIEQVLAENSQNVEALNNKGLILQGMNRLAEAEAAYREVVALRPHSSGALRNLAQALQLVSRIDEAVACCRTAFALDPSDSTSLSNLIFALDLHREATTEEQQAERRRWNALHGQTAQPLSPKRASQPEKKLRVGYVSADFRNHSAAYAFGLVIANHDPEQVEVLCYSNGVADETTDCFKRLAVGWRDIRGLSDEAVACLVREDDIDILVDLSGHTAGNRLAVFARKPAPVQVTAWGHGNGTGLTAFDALFSDPVAIPPSERHLYGEPVIDLPCFICFDRPEDAPDVVERAADRPFTFGSFNRLSKLSSETLDAWQRIMAACPQARLLIKDRRLDDSLAREALLENLVRRGIDAERITFVGATDRAGHLAAYGDVDLSLDPFPHGGGISTFESLWMGVPVLTLTGPSHTGRLASAILHHVCLDDFIAASEDDYVRRAIELASGGGAGLDALRSSLRPRLASSPAADGPAYAAAVERAYRELWRTACGQPQEEPKPEDKRIVLPPPSHHIDAPLGDLGFIEANYLVEQGQTLLEQGRPAEALDRFRLALAIRPDHVDTWVAAAHAQHRLGHDAAALATLLQLTANHPQGDQAKGPLAAQLQQMGRRAEALTLYDEILVENPNHLEVLSNVGSIQIDTLQFEEARATLERALKIGGTASVSVLMNMGCTCHKEGTWAAARDWYMQALDLDPHHELTTINLCNTLIEIGEFAEARDRFEALLATGKISTAALSGLGKVYRSLGRNADAEHCQLRAIAISPHRAEGHFLLGNVYMDQGRSDLAIASFRRAIELQPNHSIAYINLGCTLQLAGRIDEARAAYEQAMRVEPAKDAVTNLIFLMDYEPDATTAKQQALRRRWYEAFGAAETARREPHHNDRSPERRLRVGYVSADFRNHSAAHCFGLVVMNHDSETIETFLYSNTVIEDSYTERFKASTPHWRRVLGTSDDELHDLIRQDRIDVLVDLSGHTSGSRLKLFCRKPAPVQVTAWGHGNGTGVPTIDALLSDPVATLPEERPLYAEHILDLPCFICYDVPPAAPALAPLLAQSNGYVTFGCLNRISKVSPAAIDAWIRLLEAVPTARLVLKDRHLEDETKQDDLRRHFAERGIAGDRLTLIGGTSQIEHMRAYGMIDIALDPFPYGGGISTMEALWMGAPVVTLMGRTHTGRLAAAITAALGLDHLIAHDVDEYIAIAARLAGDFGALADFRQKIRPQMAQSPVANPKLYTQAVEQHYRGLWRNWCATGQAVPGR